MKAQEVSVEVVRRDHWPHTWPVSWLPPTQVPPDTPVLVRLSPDPSLPGHPLVGQWESASHAWTVQYLGRRTLPTLTTSGEPVVLGWMELPA